MPVITRCARSFDRFYQSLTGRIRLLPDFVIIGAQKGGTTFLYKLLQLHPNVQVSGDKEIRYFDLHFDQPCHWYRSHFRSWPYRWYARHLRQHTFLTGEASPSYMYYPHVPARMAAVIPQAKLIAVLRNPVDRAYSNYYHEVRKGREHLSFEEALAAEDERLRGEREKMLADPGYHSYNYSHFSYLHRGIYVEQLQAFQWFWENKQCLVIQSEELYAHPERVLADIQTFLNLPAWQPSAFAPANVGAYPEIRSATRAWLTDYFCPHNHRLYRFLGKDLGW